jgi:RND family efflux transporter MFP subunit
MSDQSQSNPHSGPRDQTPGQQPVSARAVILGFIAVLLVACVISAIGILGRMRSATVLAKQTRALAAPTVGVAPPQPGSPVDTLVLPGNVTAYTDAPIYARTDGYLTRWYYDIGAHVQKGALLAVISSPEVDQQLAQAEADLATAQTNAKNAKVQADRYSDLVKSNSVSRLDTDTFVTQAAAAASAVHSAQANVDRLRAMQSFEKIYAPFSGVITARNVDTGQLINAGAGSAAGTELFHMQAVQVLRVYASVPQVYSGTVKRGMKVPLTFPQFPGKSFEGTLVRTANAIDPASRTLLVEIDVNNRDDKLLPGALAQVHFRTTATAPTFIIPTSALIFHSEGLRVATVINNNQGTVAHLAPVEIGQDDGATVQVVNGLNPSDRVIQDPPDSLIEGERVTVISPGSGSGDGDVQP